MASMVHPEDGTAGALALALLLGVSGRAHAGYEPPTPGLVDDLLVRIGDHSSYDVSQARADPPEIRFCAEGDLLDYPGEGTVVEPDERGVYDFEARIVYLVEPWDPPSLRDRATLLHELVHDVQFLNRDWPCPNATERMAYKLHEAKLAERGIEAHFDWLVIYFWSRCRQSPHP